METELVVQPEQGLQLFGTSEPQGVVQKATKIADVLAPLIEKKKLYVTVGGKKHVYVEGWTTMINLLGVFPFVEYSHKVDKPDGIAYDSRVLLKHISGLVVGAGEALCSSDEKNWANKDEFQIKSMSQTRATGKAARLSFSWIMGLAGYEPTPAEEMESEQKPSLQPPTKMESNNEAKSLTFIPKAVGKKADAKGRDRYWVKLPSGGFAGTYNEEDGEAILEAKDKEANITLTMVIQGEFVNITKAEIKEGQ